MYALSVGCCTRQVQCVDRRPRRHPSPCCGRRCARLWQHHAHRRRRTSDRQLPRLRPLQSRRLEDCVLSGGRTAHHSNPPLNRAPRRHLSDVRAAGRSIPLPICNWTEARPEVIISTGRRHGPPARDGAFPVLDPRGFYSTSGACSVSPFTTMVSGEGSARRQPEVGSSAYSSSPRRNGHNLHRGGKSRFGFMMAVRIVCVGKRLKTQARCARHQPTDGPDAGHHGSTDAARHRRPSDRIRNLATRG